jgi:hypothetical protein
MPISECIAHAGPIRGFRGRHKSIGAGCIRAVGDAFKSLDSIIVKAANFAESSFGNDVIRFLRVQII